jgi:hypothetical protein
VRGVKKVRLRFVANSADAPDFLDEFIPGDATVAPSAGSEAEHDHDHDHDHGVASGEARKRK